jgi:hypothetical protein
MTGLVIVLQSHGVIGSPAQAPSVSCDRASGGGIAAQTAVKPKPDQGRVPAAQNRAAPSPRVDQAFYVSPQGNDAWSGRSADKSANQSDGPFATLERARDAVRQSKTIRTIYIRGGRYQFASPLTFTDQDSKIQILAMPGEVPVISGGTVVSLTESTADKLGRFNVPLSQDPGDELFIAGERQFLAAKPNDAPVSRDGWRIADHADGTEAFAFRSGDIQPSDIEPLPQIEIIDPTRAFSVYTRIASVDFAKQIATLVPAGHGEDIPVGTYRLLGHVDWVQKPGTFAWDSAKALLTTMPSQTAGGSRSEIVIPTTAALFILDGASDVTIKGITFEATKTGYGDEQNTAGVVLRNARGVNVLDNNFRDVGKAIRLIGSHASRIARNVVVETGSSGIELQDDSDDNFVLDNKLSKIGQMDDSSKAIALHGASGNQIARNVIDQASRHGIAIDNWDDTTVNRRNIVEYNRVLHTSTVASDTGAIEMLGRSGIDTQSVIRFNEIEDAGGLSIDEAGNWRHGEAAAGIYLDDLTSGVLVCGNFIRGAGLAAIQIHGGFGVTVRNNVAILDRPNSAFIFLQGATPVSGGDRFAFSWHPPSSIVENSGVSQSDHKIEVRFDNDASINGEDRDLYISAIEINGHRFAATDDNARYVTDDGRTLPGQIAVPWNGQLIWNLPADVLENAGDPIAVAVVGWGIPAQGVGAHFVISFDDARVGDGFAVQPKGFMANNTITRNIVYAVSPGKSYYKFLAGSLPSISKNNYVDITGSRQPAKDFMKDSAPLVEDPHFANPIENDFHYQLSQKLISEGFGELPTF